MLFKDVLLRTKRGLSLYKVYGSSRLPGSPVTIRVHSSYMQFKIKRNGGEKGEKFDFSLQIH